MQTQRRQSAKLVVQFSELGPPPPPPPPAGECAPLPPVLGGGAHSLAREGLGESQFRRGTYTVVLFVYMYFVVYRKALHYILYLCGIR